MNEPELPDDAELSAAMMRLSAEVRHEQSLNTRRAVATERQIAADEARFGGLLRDLAERGVSVAVDVIGGRRYVGPITSCGEDYCVIGSTAIAVWAVAVLELDGDARRQPLPSAREGDGNTQSLAGLLADFAAQRMKVRVWAEGQSTPAAGELFATGDDMITVASGDRTIYIPIDRVTEVTTY